jgi:hypothetical protein
MGVRPRSHRASLRRFGLPLFQQRADVLVVEVEIGEFAAEVDGAEKLAAAVLREFLQRQAA